MTAAPAKRASWFRRRKWWLLGGAVLVIYGFTGGCYAQQLPRLNTVDQVLAARAPLPYSVLVVDWDSAWRAKTSQNPDAYAHAALTFLTTSHAFRSVRLGAVGADSADLVAISNGGYCNSAVVPMFTILTLGIIPTIFTDTDCGGVILRRYPGVPGSDSVPIGGRRDSRVVMGWVAVLVGALPGWTHGDIHKHSRTGAMLRAAVQRRQDAIESLLR